MSNRLRLGVNIDHVATIRNARGGDHPDPVRAALIAAEAGADGITAHLREDRRHITDGDIDRLMAEIDLPLNLEMAATEEMLAIALAHRPHAACVVPEKREERTTEGGLDAAGQFDHLAPFVGKLGEAGIRVSLFIEPSERQVDAALRLGAPVVEFHTGRYAHVDGEERTTEGGLDAAGQFDHLAPMVGQLRSAGVRVSLFIEPSERQVDAALRLGAPVVEFHTGRYAHVEGDDRATELKRIADCAALAVKNGIEPHAGHGLTFDNVLPVAAIPQLAELNIGHFLIGEAIFTGLDDSVRRMRALMDEAR